MSTTRRPRTGAIRRRHRQSSGGIDDVVDEQHRPAGEAGGDIADELHDAAAFFGHAVAGEPHELDLGASARVVERAGEVGNRHRRPLEQTKHDEIGWDHARDLGDERLDARSDLRRDEAWHDRPRAPVSKGVRGEKHCEAILTCRAIVRLWSGFALPSKCVAGPAFRPDVWIGSRAAVVASLMVRPVCLQLRKYRVRPGNYAWCHNRTYALH
jgi:hypothetical protein